MIFWVIVICNKNYPEEISVYPLGYGGSRPAFTSIFSALQSLQVIQEHDKAYIAQRNAKAELRAIVVEPHLLHSLNLTMCNE